MIYASLATYLWFASIAVWALTQAACAYMGLPDGEDV